MPPPTAFPFIPQEPTTTVFVPHREQQVPFPQLSLLTPPCSECKTFRDAIIFNYPLCIKRFLKDGIIPQSHDVKHAPWSTDDHLECLQVLLNDIRCKKFIEQRDPGAETILHHVAKANRVRLVEVILNSEASTTKGLFNDEWDTFLFRAAEIARHYQTSPPPSKDYKLIAV